MDASRATLKREFPGLPLSEEWLTECVNYLRTSDPRFGNEKALIDAVRVQFLASDLRDSLDGAQIEPRLVQITGVTDVGVSAFSLLEAIKKRREDASVAIPRSMLRLELSDGIDTMTAYEHTRIDFLSIDVPLGTKLLLRSPAVESGVLILKQENVSLVGGVIPELAQDGERRLEETLCTKLGLQVSEQPRTGPRPATHSSSSQPQHLAADRPQTSNADTAPQTGPQHRALHSPAAQPLTVPSSPAVDDIWDIDAEQALVEAEQALQNTPAALETPQPSPADSTQSSGTQSALLSSLKTLTPVPSNTRKRQKTPSTTESLKIPAKKPIHTGNAPSDPIELSSDNEYGGETITLSDSDD
ncbi:hypothetical protein MCUN1_000380 [Malassezia cuniculi]|uniref:RecQ-mediated genome instability protein 1 n=1 Tax=Malassezia cuniculi TaxID=948313 RepID=A0AAF0J4M3_9BASI|nr:hypothetical protein MCUN1_000380 [Malassezia cuniculi]